MCPVLVEDGGWLEESAKRWSSTKGFLRTMEGGRDRMEEEVRPADRRYWADNRAQCAHAWRRMTRAAAPALSSRSGT